MGVEVRELPDVDRPVVGVSASLPGGAPETVDAEVTSILEGAAARVSGVRNINSQSEENSARISIEFNPGVDLDVVAAEVREAVNQVRRELPDDVEQINVRKADNHPAGIQRLMECSLIEPFELVANTTEDIGFTGRFRQTRRKRRY